MDIRWPGASAAAGLLIAAAGCGSAGTDLVALDNPAADGGGSTTSGNPPPTSYQDPFANAPPYAPQGGGDGSHNSGRACMQSGCHGAQGGQGSEAPSFLVGGTVYADYYAKTPLQGVEVRILDSAGNAASAYSDRGGNFYIRAGQSSVTFPAVIGARNGSTSRPMIRQLTSAAMGSCGQSTCHVPGGSPKAGDYYPIHVP